MPWWAAFPFSFHVAISASLWLMILLLLFKALLAFSLLAETSLAPSQRSQSFCPISTHPDRILLAISHPLLVSSTCSSSSPHACSVSYPTLQKAEHGRPLQGSAWSSLAPCACDLASIWWIAFETLNFDGHVFDMLF